MLKVCVLNYAQQKEYEKNEQTEDLEDAEKKKKFIELKIET